MPLLVTPGKDLLLMSCNYGDKTQHITSYLFHSLKEIIIGYDINQCWLRKGKWEEGDDERVDTSVFKHGLSNAPQYKRVWLEKWNSGFCGVGENLARWRHQIHSMYLHCSATEETIKYVMNCPQNKATLYWLVRLK